jgi:hypothetical protein
MPKKFYEIGHWSVFTREISPSISFREISDSNLVLCTTTFNITALSLMALRIKDTQHDNFQYKQ